MKHLLPLHHQESIVKNKIFLRFKTLFYLLIFSIPLIGFTQTHGPGSPYVDAGDDVTLTCGEECTELSADFLDTGETTTYSVSSIPYSTPYPFRDLTNRVSVNIDDRWSSVINLPFDFCFFGDVYSRVVIGSNGVISFDTSQAGGFCDYTLGAREAIPNPSLHKNSIMLYHDINPAYGNNQIGWELFGDFPNRALVVSFYNVPYYNFGNPNNTATSTFQMVMYETTNAIDFFVESKPDPHNHVSSPINGGRAVLGIQNAAGNQGYTAPGRNTGVWEAQNEAWRFMPTGESNVTFAWLDEAGEIVSTDRTFTVCPTEQTTTYTAKAIWLNCNGDEVTVTDDVTVTRESEFTVDLGEDQELCNQTEFEIIAELDGADPSDATFLWNTGETTQSITVTETGTYSVEVTVGECTISDSVTITFNENPEIDLGPDQTSCFTEPIILDASPINYSDPMIFTYEWSRDGEVLTGETNPTLEVHEPGEYTVVVNLEDCSSTASVTIDAGESPEIDLGDDRYTCLGEPEVLDASPVNYPDPAVFTYEWSKDGEVLLEETNPTLVVNEPGHYSVIVTLGECIGAASVIIEAGENPEVDLGEDRSTCMTEPEILDASPMNYPDPMIFTYEWSKDGEILLEETFPTLEVFEPGYYGVKVSLGNCFAEDYITISPGDGLEVDVIMEGYGPSPAGGFELCPKEPRILKAVTDAENVTYQWYLNGEILSGETNSTLEISLEAGTMGMQTYSVTISSGGCTGSGELDVRLYEAGNCVISQGLTPNGDGFNDVLDLTFLNDRTGIRNLQIFNRYGTKVYEQNNYTNQWFGQTNDGKDLPTGTYYYVIDLNGEDPVYGQQTTGWIYLNQKVK